MGGVEVKLDTALVLEAQKGGQEGFTKLYQAVRRGLGNVYRSVPRTFRPARSTGIYAMDLPDFVGKMQPKDPGLCSGQK